MYISQLQEWKELEQSHWRNQEVIQFQQCQYVGLYNYTGMYGIVLGRSTKSFKANRALYVGF